MDLHQRGALDLSGCTWAVLDEADEMLRMGFQEEVRAIFDTLPPPGAPAKAGAAGAGGIGGAASAEAGAPVSRTTMLWSATVPSWVRDLASRYCAKPQFIDLIGAHEQKLPPTAAFRSHLVTASSRQETVAAVLTALVRQGSSGSADGATRVLVFTDTKREAADLGHAVAIPGARVTEITGDLSQALREKAIADFRAGRVQVLFATDVAARGIDIPDVDAVVHYRLPREMESFVHRSGRTARAGRSGAVVVLMDAGEARMLAGWEAKLQFSAAVTALPRLDAATLVSEAQPRVLSGLRGVPASLNAAVRASGLWAKLVPADAPPALLQHKLADALAVLALGGTAAASTAKGSSGGSGVPGVTLATSLLSGERGFVTVTLHPFAGSFAGLAGTSAPQPPASGSLAPSAVTACVVAFCNALGVAGTDRPRRVFAVAASDAAAASTATAAAASASAPLSAGQPTIVFDLPAAALDKLEEASLLKGAALPLERTEVLPRTVKTAAFAGGSGGGFEGRGGRSGGRSFGGRGGGGGYGGRGGGGGSGYGGRSSSYSGGGGGGGGFRDRGEEGGFRRGGGDRDFGGRGGGGGGGGYRDDDRGYGGRGGSGGSYGGRGGGGGGGNWRR